jgi:hypothetical protein
MRPRSPAAAGSSSGAVRPNVPFWQADKTVLTYETVRYIPPADGFRRDGETRLNGHITTATADGDRDSTPSLLSCPVGYHLVRLHSTKSWRHGRINQKKLHLPPERLFPFTGAHHPACCKRLRAFSEFTHLTPQATYPIKRSAADLSMSFSSTAINASCVFPSFPRSKARRPSRVASHVYRERLHKTNFGGIYFHPDIPLTPPHLRTISDQFVVTPLLGKSLLPNGTRKDHVAGPRRRGPSHPCHNSVMSWSLSRPTPQRAFSGETLDSLRTCSRCIVEAVGLAHRQDAMPTNGQLLQWGLHFAPSL